MLNRQRIVGLLVSSMCGTAMAAPSLTMHVFEQEDVNNSPIVTANETQSPLLTMHVFDGSPQLQNNAVVLPYKNRPEPRKKISRQVSNNTNKTEAYIKTGYRRDKFDGSIADPTGSPNVMSELKWRDIEISTFNIGSTFILENDWIYNFDLVYGRIFDGESQDSDYLGNNRTLEFSRSYSMSNKGQTYDLSASVGKRYGFSTTSSKLTNLYIIPKIGLSYSSQDLTMKKGIQVIPSVSLISGLDSSYEASWFGPWSGLELQFEISPKLTVSSNLELHYTEYNAKANWNLRSDLAHPKSFKHDAKGYGIVSSIDGKYQFNDTFAFTLSLNYQYWNADRDGVDTTYFSDGSSSKMKLNEVNWRSFGTNIGLVYEF